MIESLEEFSALYSRRPIQDNQGGMKAPHMFAVWFMVRTLAPDWIVESGIWKGQSTWLLEQACPKAKLVAIDLNLGNRVYISRTATYSDRDFSEHDWSAITERSLAFFDDHQNAYLRLQQCAWFGFQHVIFEDNYPSTQGDCYSLKKAFAHAGFSQGAAAAGRIAPNAIDARSLHARLEVYHEFPPVLKTARTRWGDAWEEPAYPTPAPLLDRAIAPAHRMFLEEATSYTWICYAKLRPWRPAASDRPSSAEGESPPVVSERLGSEYGGWNVALDLIDRSSVVYSFGVGEDVTFDLALISRCGVVVHAFDPTPRSIAWVRKQELPKELLLHEYGLADHDGDVYFYPPENPAHVSHTVLERPATQTRRIQVPVKRLRTILSELGHEQIDILKMDIEGAEYRVLDDMEESGIRPVQLLIEFHHRFPGVGVEKTRRALRGLERMGYRLFSASPSGEELCFVHEAQRRVGNAAVVAAASTRTLPGSEPQPPPVLVSAIVAHTGARALSDCLEDLERQTLARSGLLEIIVVDCGLNDSEVATVQALQALHPNIRYLPRDGHASVCEYWNRAIAVARGRYLTIANAGERRRSDALEVLASVLDGRLEIPLCFGRVHKTHEADGRPLRGTRAAGPCRLSDLLNDTCTIEQPLWRRAIHEELGLFDPAFGSAGAVELWLRMAQRDELLLVDDFLGDVLERPDDDRSPEIFELAIIHRCCWYLVRRCATVGREGLSECPTFDLRRWYGLNLLRRRRAERSGATVADLVQQTDDGRRGPPPALTVVVATSRHQALHETLGCLAAQRDRDFEIVITDASGDRAPLSGLSGTELCHLRLSEDLGPAVARNLAAEVARTRYVAFLDDGALPDQGWVEALLASFRAHGVAGVCGRIVPRGADAEDPDQVGADGLPCLCEEPGSAAFDRETFLAAGGFDADLLCYEGIDLAFRLHDRRLTVLSCPAAVVRRDPLAENHPRYLEEAVRSRILEHLSARSGFLPFVDAMRFIHAGNRRYADLTYDALVKVGELLEPYSVAEAMHSLERAVALAPRAIRGTFLLGSLYFRHGRNAQALPLLERALQLLADEMHAQPAAEQPAVAAGYLAVATRLGQCLMALGELAEVGALYTRLLAHPGLPLTRAQREAMGNVIRKLGSRQEHASAIRPGAVQRCTSSPI
jgi:FkbM family methyltransferase